MYTFNFAYVGSRTTGREAGSFLLVGPSWDDAAPTQIKQVIRCETEFAFVLYRTQLFDPGDIENVKAVQAGYKVEPLVYPRNLDDSDDLDRHYWQQKRMVIGGIALANMVVLAFTITNAGVSACRFTVSGSCTCLARQPSGEAAIGRMSG